MEDTVMVKSDSPTYHEWGLGRQGTHTACGRYAQNTLWVTGWVEMKRVDAVKKKSRCKGCARVVGSETTR